jgi:mannose-6-phosphate isomerase
VKPAPFRIEPTFSPRIWGTRSLAPIFPEKTNLAEPVGEAGLTDVQCQIANGPFVGKTLGEVWSELPPEWRGERCATMRDFPLLVKFIFPTDKLSIQVHPDDAYASVHEVAAGGHGKTEMWHAVSAEPGAQLFLGFKPGVNKQQFLNAIASSGVEDLLEAHPVQAGDTFFVPPGTPHTIGPGMILCEVQEYSDLTYRVYDYGRVDARGKPRELHIEKALEVMTYDPTLGSKVSTQRKYLTDKIAFEHLVSSPYFDTDRWEIDSTFDVRRALRTAFSLWIFLSGTGDVNWVVDQKREQPSVYSGSFQYQKGECWFMPAGVASFTIHPVERTVLLETHFPTVARVDSPLA